MKIFFVLTAIIIPSLLHAQGVWTNDSLPEFGMSYAQSEVINGKIYVINWGIVRIDKNGLSTLDSATLSIFDPVMHTWSYPAEAVPFRGSFASCSDSGKMYIIGAESDSLANKIEVFDPASNTWSNISYTGTFTRRTGLTVSAVGGKIYAIGGFSNGKDLNIIEVFDPSTHSWNSPEIGGTFTPRDGHTATVLNGKIYVMGGENGPLIGNLQVFDPQTNSWSTPVTTGIFTPRAGLTSSVLGGKIYAIGGYNFAPKINVVEVFDTSTNTWSTPKTTGTFTARLNLSSSVVNDKIYVIGGIGFINDQNSTFFIPGNFNEVFSPSASDVASQQVSQLSLSPNPTTGVLSVQGLASDNITVSVFNILGETVMVQKNLPVPDFTLDLSKLVPGTYYIRFSSPNSVVTKKVIRQ